MVASLGGYQGKNSEPEPGFEVLWRGLVRLNDFCFIFKIIKILYRIE